MAGGQTGQPKGAAVEGGHGVMVPPTQAPVDGPGLQARLGCLAGPKSIVLAKASSVGDLVDLSTPSPHGGTATAEDPGFTGFNVASSEKKANANLSEGWPGFDIQSSEKKGDDSLSPF